MSTFPRNGSHDETLGMPAGCTERRKLVSHFGYWRAAPRGGCQLLTSASRGPPVAARGYLEPLRQHRRNIFIECTAISASPIEDRSSSLTNTPLPPSVLSETSCLRSPSVERPALQPQCQAQHFDLSNLVRLPLGEDAFRVVIVIFHWPYYLVLC